MPPVQSRMLPLGTIAPDFDLPAVNRDARVRLADFKGRPLLVMFICNHCPFVKHVRAELAAIGRECQDKGVGVVAIMSNDFEAYPDDAPEKMKREAEAAGYAFPYLVDESQAVAKAYSAACTPDFYLFDRGHRLVYRGQLDDSRPSSGTPVSGRDLRAAIEAVLAGRPVSADQRPSLGCSIKWKRGNEPEYAGR